MFQVMHFIPSAIVYSLLYQTGSNYHGSYVRNWSILTLTSCSGSNSKTSRDQLPNKREDEIKGWKWNHSLQIAKLVNNNNHPIFDLINLISGRQWNANSFDFYLSSNLKNLASYLDGTKRYNLYILSLKIIKRDLKDFKIFGLDFEW